MIGGSTSLGGLVVRGVALAINLDVNDSDTLFDVECRNRAHGQLGVPRSVTRRPVTSFFDQLNFLFSSTSYTCLHKCEAKRSCLVVMIKQSVLHLVASDGKPFDLTLGKIGM